MSQIVDLPKGLASDEPAPLSRRGPSWLRQALAALASLRLTVVLFALSLVLVLAGTVAQVDEGNWTVVSKYIRTFYVWIPLQIFVPRSIHVPGGFPFPGGWLIGAALLVNLLAAHLTRFRVSWKRSGILVLHAGLILMLLGELVTGLCAVEANMTIAVGETVNFVDVKHQPFYVDQKSNFELALTDSSDPKEDDVIAVPGSRLQPGRLIQDAVLPADIRVDEYHKNSDVKFVPPVMTAPAPDVFRARGGEAFRLVPRGETSGVDTEQREDMPLTRVTFLAKGESRELGTFVVSPWLYPNATRRNILVPPQKLTVGDKTYAVELRPMRIEKPYALHLLEFHHDKFVGTDTPRNFSSLVRVTDPTRDESREVLIYMNTPLRYEGDTFYQSAWLDGDKGTILQVVRNPGWLLPYFSCALVTLGMAVHFGIQLNGFLRRRATS